MPLLQQTSCAGNGGLWCTLPYFLITWLINQIEHSNTKGKFHQAHYSEPKHYQTIKTNRFIFWRKKEWSRLQQDLVEVNNLAWWLEYTKIEGFKVLVLVDTSVWNLIPNQKAIKFYFGQIADITQSGGKNVGSREKLHVFWNFFREHHLKCSRY